MRLLAFLALATAVVAVDGCDSAQTFTCHSNRDCTRPDGQGVCVMGSCAFPSPTCPSGYVYDKTASGNAGKCVPVGSVGDDMAASMMDMAGDGFFTSSPDMSTGDMATGPIDMAVSGGPWMTVSGGSAGTDYQSIWGTDNGAGHIFIVGRMAHLGRGRAQISPSKGFQAPVSSRSGKRHQ